MRHRIESSSRRGDRTKNLVGFQVGDVRYAVEIFRVREIINPLPFVVLPHAPKVVLGVADHRGEVVPVIDLRPRFGLPQVPNTRKSRWIIVRTKAGSVGLAVDAVTDVFGTATEGQRNVPDLGAGDEARGIQAVFMHNRQLVFVIDVDKVAAPAEVVDVGFAQKLLGEGET
ncbi:MAG: chemotaxis protein CheW [Polyangiales bacterium]